MNIYFRIFVTLLAVLVLSACGMKKADVVEHAAIEAPDGKDTKPIMLKKIIVKVPRGTEIGKIKAGLACVTHGKIAWRSGKHSIGDDEFSTIFFEELRRLNYNVVGDPSDMFEDKRGSAEIVVGGLITSINLDVCYPMGGFGDVANGDASASLTVEWQVYNALDKKTIFKTTATGGGNAKFTAGMANEAVYLAFANSVRGLLANKRFLEIVTEGDSFGSVGGNDQDGKKKDDFSAVNTVKYSHDVKNVADAQQRVVVIQLGGGHGSGFLLGDSGNILTNHHVVAGNKKVRVILADGSKVEGQVLKSDPRQDVAVVQIASPGIKGLTARLDDMTVGADVYAIGAPRDMELQGSVSKGVISSYRTDKRGRWIQSDTTINGGNSGGPLVDAQGRVVGISSWKFVDNNTTGLNFFVPIANALQVLGL